LAIETKSLLLGEAASPEAVARIARALTSTDGVERIIHMKTLHLGPEEVLVAAKIAVVPCDTAVEVTETIDRAEASIRETEPMVTSLYLEPDIYDPEHVPAPRPERPTAPSH
jgi:divalent metal cation (Fe/Co/Zn/Cd) transporter